jgi:S-adenosylmethionine:tRNA ribosyltransferase-isomerase
VNPGLAACTLTGVDGLSYRIEDYDYELPRELIAQEPLLERSASRLLVLDRASGKVRHRVFADLPDLLAPGDVVVVNRSRVIPARLLGSRAGGGRAEVLLVRRRAPDEWDALVRPGRRLREGAAVEVAPDLTVRVLASPSPGGALRRVRLECDGTDPDTAVESHGHVPLPPYIERADRPADRDRYQTVYAAEPGSVAAPTAGLHFTPALLERLSARGIERVDLTLHVGPGTFRPVEVNDVRHHRVAAEAYALAPEAAAALARARAVNRRIVAVGTTTTRVLESTLHAGETFRAGPGETGLVIVPGHTFRVVGALVTNFHLPRSSLLLLVAAFAGRERVLRAYQEAVRMRYRFYSYGDAMLVL